MCSVNPRLTELPGPARAIRCACLALDACARASDNADLQVGSVFGFKTRPFAGLITMVRIGKGVLPRLNIVPPHFWMPRATSN